MPGYVRSNIPHYLVMRMLCGTTESVHRYRKQLADATKGMHKQAGDKRKAVNTIRIMYRLKGFHGKCPAHPILGLSKFWCPATKVAVKMSEKKMHTSADVQV